MCAIRTAGVNLLAILLAMVGSTVHTHRLTAQLPEGWQAARHSLTPQLLDPKERFTVGTFPLRYRAVGCSQFPSSALADLGPRDALVTLQERASHRRSAEFPHRPRHFGPHRGDGRSEASECVRHARFTDHWFTFRDHSRNFHVLVAFGPMASAETREQAWGNLDSLRVRARASRAASRAGLPARGRLRRASCTCCAGACAPCSSRGSARARSACRPCPRPGA